MNFTTMGGTKTSVYGSEGQRKETRKKPFLAIVPDGFVVEEVFFLIKRAALVQSAGWIDSSILNLD